MAEQQGLPQLAVAVPLRYTCWSKPSANGRRQVLFESRGNAWRPRNASGRGGFVMDNWTAVKDVAKEIRPAKGQRLDVVVGEPAGSRFAVTMSGDEKAVHEARKTVLRAYYEIEHGSVAVDASAVLNAAGMPDEDLLHLLGEVAESAGVALMLTDFTEAEGQVGAGIDARSGRDTTRTFYVLFWGDQDAVARARVQLTSVMAFRRHQHVHVLSVPLSLQPLVAGPLRSNIATIEAVSGASFTTFGHLPRLLASSRPVSEQADAALDTMYIHGQAPAGVSLARALASEVRASTPTIVRECAVSHAKLDQLALSSSLRASALPDISSRYGTFIQLPHLGAGECLVRVQGASQYSVDRTIAELMSLCCDIYEADYYFPKDKTVSPEAIQWASHVAAASGAVVSLNSSGAHVVGPRDAVKAAVSGLADAAGDGTVSYRIEVPTEHRDFVVGRKNGKIQRVTQTSHTTVTFTPFTEHNFYVELRADTPQAACDGLELLEDELPYETNLYIHESYHKQIIGAGGERILGIMKRSQVFIKFDVPEDRYPNACSYHKPDNVVIRCPAKNARNITQAIADLRAEADAYARQYSSRTVRMTRSHRRLLLRDSVPAMHDVELKTGAVIGFPDTDAAAVSHVSVSAMGHNADQAAAMLAALFPSDYEFKVARSARFAAAVSETPDSEFTARVAVPLRIAYGVEVQIDPPAAGAAGGLAHRMPWHRIVLTYAKTKRPALDKAVEVLTAFLRECGLDIIDRADVKPEHIVPEAPQALPTGAPMARGRSLNALDANSTNMLPAMNFKPPAHHYGGENLPHEPRGPPPPCASNAIPAPNLPFPDTGLCISSHANCDDTSQIHLISSRLYFCLAWGRCPQTPVATATRLISTLAPFQVLLCCSCFSWGRCPQTPVATATRLISTPATFQLRSSCYGGLGAAPPGKKKKKRLQPKSRSSPFITSVLLFFFLGALPPDPRSNRYAVDLDTGPFPTAKQLLRGLGAAPPGKKKELQPRSRMMAHLAHARGVAGPQMAMAGRAAAPPQVRPEDIDEIGGVGDELDTISLRDIAAIRYMRHQEWLEMVLGTAVETHKITPPDIIPQNNALFKTNEPQSIKELFDKTKAEVEALEKEAAAGWNIEKPAMSEFYKKLKLHRESDAAVGADPEAYEKALAEFEREFGMTVVERKKVSKITPDLEVNTNGPKKTEPTAAKPETVGEPASEPANDASAEPSAGPSAEPAAETTNPNAEQADNDDIDMDMPLPSAAEDAMADLGDDTLMQDMLKDTDDLSDVLNL